MYNIKWNDQGLKASPTLLHLWQMCCEEKLPHMDLDPAGLFYVTVSLGLNNLQKAELYLLI